MFPLAEGTIDLNSYLVPLYMFPLEEGILEINSYLVALYMYKYARTLISMVFFCNWCSAADSSFFSSSTISSSLFFDSLCSCGDNKYIILMAIQIVFLVFCYDHTDEKQIIDKFYSTNTCQVFRKRSMLLCSELAKFTFMIVAID